VQVGPDCTWVKSRILTPSSALPASPHGLLLGRGGAAFPLVIKVRTVRDNGRMLGMSERQLMRHVYWPSALSWMFSSLHTSVGFAVVGAVVGEYLGSAAGLGYLIQQAEGVFDVAGVFAGMFVLSAFVILIDLAVTLVERRLLVWRPNAGEARA